MRIAGQPQANDLAKTMNVAYLVVDNKIVGRIVTVLYTPGQLRSAVSVAPETYRHWKKALRPLQRARGHSPCFSSGDLVAMAVIRLLTVDIGIRVGALTPTAEALFDVVNRSPWPVLERSKLIIDVSCAEVLIRGDFAERPTSTPFITIPLAPVIAQLREQLLTETLAEDQPSLRFPPVEIAPTVVSRGGRP